MFDSLKDKLGSFRDDAEEVAEEKAEEADADEVDPEADAETTADGEPAPDDVGDPESDAAVEEAEEAVAEAESPETATAAEAVPREDDAPLPEDDGGPAEGSDDADADDAEGSDDSGGTGFARKAKAVATGKFVIEEEDLEDPLWELEMALLESDVEMSVAEEILDTLREELVGETRGFTESTGSVVEDALREALLEVISVGQFDFDERVAEADKPLVIIFTGVNGVGKTTTIAKLSRYLEDRGYSSVLANGDTYRAGANEQIQEHADALDRKLIAHQQGGDPAAVIYDAVEYAEANDVDVVLGDTAGRLHTDEGLMDQLEKIGRVVGPDMTLFVDEAVAGQDAVQRAKQFDEAAAIDGSVLTKADADPQGGAAISIAHVTGKPILFLGTGQEYDDIERFDPDEMVERLVGGE
ncbi:signal recognition particle-docking protein FtsY [Halostella litorea]|uniref:signal recognition particle-docking protein FtsY n=1 Tax=Halostella litorea TaxID=2528831 RepID=UPI001092A335|nr:signal recognition particle-docking protein FtsY [Halostella litorea]